MRASAEWPPGWFVTFVAETGSTNIDLVRAGERGAVDRTVLAADHQTAGRGRLDRRWDAPPGSNLLVSMLLREIPDHAHQLTQRVGLAAVAAAKRLAGVAASLKWPNDIIVGDAKLAGVLAQRGATTGDPSAPFVVVGIGVNIGWAPPGAARLGDGVTPREFLAVMLAEFDGLVDVADRYRASLATLGQLVRVELPNETLVGRAIDVEADGRLVVLDECAISHRIDAGDVVHLRPVTD